MSGHETYKLCTARWDTRKKSSMLAERQTWFASFMVHTAPNRRRQRSLRTRHIAFSHSRMFGKR